jgi:hypothetical protein
LIEHRPDLVTPEYASNAVSIGRESFDTRSQYNHQISLAMIVGKRPDLLTADMVANVAEAASMTVCRGYENTTSPMEVFTRLCGMRQEKRP